MAISNNSTGLRPGVCTSTTRPTAPYEGQHIYETDTDIEYVWNGTAWVVTYVSANSPAFTGTPTAPTATAGTNTTQLATTAFVTTAAANVTSGFRNAIINGGFDIWQRGTSVANSGGKSYSPDRWWCSRGGAVGGITVSRQVSTQTGFSYSARIQRDSGNTSTQGIYLYQDFETINSIRFSGGNVSLSFYAKLGANYSSASSVLNYSITYGTGTDQSFYSGMTGQTTAAASTATLTSTFQRFTVTASIPSNATQISIGLFYTPVGTAGSNDWFEITGVQFEAGAVATPFEQRPIGTELALCQRYYVQYGATDSEEVLCTGATYATSATYAVGHHPVEMRRRPDLSVDTNATRLYIAGGAFYYTASSYNQGKKTFGLYHGGGAPTAGQSGFISTAANLYVKFSAEL